jgi:drug/metabolite transporter (DMT)-like permease
LEAGIWGAMRDRPAPPPPISAQETPERDAAPVAAAAPPRIAFAALLLGNVVLAIGPWFVRLADVGPVASGFWRLVLAIPFLFLIAWRSGQRFGRIGSTLWITTILAGGFFALDLACWHEGILRAKLANATLLGNISTFLFPVYGFIVTRTLPGRWQALAIALAALGTTLLLGRSYQLSPDRLAGDLFCLAAGLSYAGYMIAVDRARATLGTWPTLAIATVAAAVALLPAALLIEGSIRPHHWAPLVALAIGSQVVGQGLLVYAIGILPPLIVGLALLTQPLVAAAIGWSIYGERLTPPDIAGALLIATALVLVRRRPAG